MTSYMDTGQWRVWEALQRFLKMHGEFWKIKAAGGRRSALDRSWFMRPFHPDCEYGETVYLGEMAAEGSVVCRRFPRSSHPRWTGV